VAALDKLFTFIALAESGRHLHLHFCRYCVCISCGLSWVKLKEIFFLITDGGALDVDARNLSTFDVKKTANSSAEKWLDQFSCDGADPQFRPKSL